LDKELQKVTKGESYKIFDKYGANVVSFAILADENPDFRENVYSYKRK